MFDEFGGATMVLTFDSREKLAEAVTILLEEPYHDHNFKVAKDGNRLYASTTAMECLVSVAQRKAYNVNDE